MAKRKNELKRKRRSSANAVPRTRTSLRRKAVKNAQIAKARQKGEARNAARALGLPAPPRKRKTEPVTSKPVARPNTSIPAVSKP